MRVFLSIRQLELRNQPGIIVRDRDLRHVVWEPAAARVDLVAWMLDTLEPDELAQFCEAYGVTFPLPNWCVSSRPLMLYVPKMLRLPGAPMLQGGGMELCRRARAGQLALEQAAVRAENLGLAADLQAVDDLAAA